MKTKSELEVNEYREAFETAFKPEPEPEPEPEPFKLEPFKPFKPKIAIILGTRAELIKTFPLMQELAKRNIEYYFIHSGQHSLGNLCDIFNVKRPDVIVTEEPSTSSKFNSNQMKAIKWNMDLIFKLRYILRSMEGLKVVVYHGDTMTTASAALASSRFFNLSKKYKTAHLEAGLRSFNLNEPFPEELSRRVAGKFSDILFAVSNTSFKNIKRKRNVHLTGNTVVDSVHYALSQLPQGEDNHSKERYCVMTVHRHENIKSLERMKRIVSIVNNVTIPVHFYLHDNTKAKMEEYGLLSKLGNHVKIKKPLDYIEFIKQMRDCSLILCDGGSMQEESLIFGKPCIIFRNATERPEGLEFNYQYLSRFDVDATIEKVKQYLSPDFKPVQHTKNPYGEKGLTSKIVDILLFSYC